MLFGNRRPERAALSAPGASLGGMDPLSATEGARTGAHDRREHSSATHDPIGNDLVLGGLVIIAMFMMAASSAPTGDVVPWLDDRAMSGALTTFSTVMAWAAACLCWVRWRLTAEPASYWVASGLIVLSVVTVGVGELFAPGPATGPAGSGLSLVRPVSLVVVLVLFAQGLRSWDVQPTIRPFVSLATAIGAVTGLAVMLQLLPSSATPQAGGLPGLRTSAVILPAIMTAAWCTVSSQFMWRGVQVRDDLMAWSGLLLFGLTLSELLTFTDGGSQVGWATAAQLVRAATLTVVLAGVAQGLQRVFAHQSGRVFHSSVQAKDARARIDAQQAEVEERAHETRNALMAIEGASATLERHGHRLDPSTRDGLARALSGEIQRLQRLVGHSTETDYRISFRVADVVDGQLMLARAQGMHILVDVPHHLTAYGRPADVAEVLQNLLTNARHHAPSSPVTIRATLLDGHVLLRVEDRGPGVPGPEKEAIFERGRRASPAEGSGLGLYVSARLLEDQDGRLTVEDRPGGGASFVLRLPREAR